MFNGKLFNDLLDKEMKNGSERNQQDRMEEPGQLVRAVLLQQER
jgi:hypothetical protein